MSRLTLRLRHGSGEQFHARADRGRLAPDDAATPDELLTRAGISRNAPYAPTPDNRPQVLAGSRLALTADNRSQMSFGERAAMEGVLAQLRPGVALEVGTAEGGSLRRIARYSGHVHSIDLDHTPCGEDVPDNVTLHTGDSHQLLPGVLRELAAAAAGLDLALVDGDHSFEGVQRDLRAIVDSPCAANCVILVHDTMNPEVRAGIEAVGVESLAEVIYVELDFVCGYVYRRGAAQGSAWGGLGLIITGPERSAAYRDSPRQTLYHEPYAALQRLRTEPATTETSA
jgi:hypothetical protein